MVPCLVTLTDLYTRRAGVPASAELLVVLAAGRENRTTVTEI